MISEEALVPKQGSSRSCSVMTPLTYIPPGLHNGPLCRRVRGILCTYYAVRYQMIPSVALPEGWALGKAVEQESSLGGWMLGRKAIGGEWPWTVMLTHIL